MLKTNNKRARLLRTFGLFVCVGLSTAVISHFTASAEASDGYTFSDFRVEYPTPTDSQFSDPERYVVLHYAIGWAGDKFPGWRSCYLRLTADDGSIVAEKSIDVVDLTSEALPRTSLIKIPEGTAKEATAASGDCLPGRSDDPSGEWVFSELSLEKGYQNVEDDRSYTLRFDASWTAVGSSGVQACILNGTDVEGKQIVDYPFNFTDVGGTSDNLEMRVILDQPLEEMPSQVVVSCSAL